MTESSKPPEDPFSILPGRFFVDAAFASRGLRAFNDQVHDYFNSVRVANRHAVIVGDIGKGKTHFLKHYLYQIREDGHIGGYVDLTKLLKTIDATRFAEDTLVQLTYAWITDPKWGILSSLDEAEAATLKAFIDAELAKHNQARQTLNEALQRAIDEGKDAQARDFENLLAEQKRYSWKAMEQIFYSVLVKSRAIRPNASIFILIDEMEMLTKGNLSREVEVALLNAFKDLLESLLQHEDPAIARGTGVVIAVTGIAWHDILTKQPAFKERFGTHPEIPDYGWEDLREAVEFRLSRAGVAPGDNPFEFDALQLINKAAKGNMRRSMKWCSELYQAHLAGEVTRIDRRAVLSSIPELFSRARIESAKADLAKISNKLPQLLDYVLLSPRTAIPRSDFRATDLEVTALEERGILKRVNSDEGYVYEVIPDAFLEQTVPVDKFAEMLLQLIEDEDNDSLSQQRLEALTLSLDHLTPDLVEQVIQQLVDREDILRSQTDEGTIYRLVNMAAPDAWDEITRVIDGAWPAAASERRTSQLKLMRDSTRALLKAQDVKGDWYAVKESDNVDEFRIKDPSVGKVRVGFCYLNKQLKAALPPLTVGDVRDAVKVVENEEFDMLFVVAHAENLAGWPDTNVGLRQPDGLKRLKLTDLSEPIRNIPGIDRVHFVVLRAQDELRAKEFEKYYHETGRFPRVPNVYFRYAELARLPIGREGPVKVQLQATSESFLQELKARFPIAAKVQDMRNRLVSSRIPVPLLNNKAVPAIVNALRNAEKSKLSKDGLRSAMTNQPTWVQGLVQLRAAEWVTDSDGETKLVVLDTASTTIGALLTAVVQRLQASGSTPRSDAILEAILNDANISLPKPERKQYEQSLENIGRIIQEERGSLLTIDDDGRFQIEVQSVEERAESLSIALASLQDRLQSTPDVDVTALTETARELVAMSPAKLKTETKRIAAKSSREAHQHITRYLTAITTTDKEITSQVATTARERTERIRLATGQAAELKKRLAELPAVDILVRARETTTSTFADRELADAYAEWSTTRPAGKLEKALEGAAQAVESATPLLARDVDSASGLGELVAAQAAAIRDVTNATRAWREQLQALQQLNVTAEKEIAQRILGFQSVLKTRSLWESPAAWGAYDFELKRSKPTHSTDVALLSSNMRTQFIHGHFSDEITKQLVEGLAEKVKKTARDVELELRAAIPKPKAGELKLLERIKLEGHLLPELSKSIQDGSVRRLSAALESFATWCSDVTSAAAEARLKILTPKEKAALGALSSGITLEALFALAVENGWKPQLLVELARKGFIVGEVQVRSP